MLRSFLNEQPSVHVLKAGKSDIEHYVIVWLYLNPSKVCYENLLYAITKSICLPYRKYYYSRFIGVEIVPSIRFQDGSADRIVRISVSKNDYEMAMKLTVNDIKIESPAPGINCTWYWDPYSVEKNNKNRSWFTKNNKSKS